jgi:hypothetical protein
LPGLFCSETAPVLPTEHRKLRRFTAAVSFGIADLFQVNEYAPESL